MPLCCKRLNCGKNQSIIFFTCLYGDLKDFMKASVCLAKPFLLRETNIRMDILENVSLDNADKKLHGVKRKKERNTVPPKMK